MTTDLGHDLACVSDLDPAMIEVDGRRCLAEAIVRRLQTPRGGLLNYPNYGYDLSAFVNGDIAARDQAMIGGNIEAEALKDERVKAATATVTLTANRKLIVTLSITDADGPFTLVLSVSAVTIDLLQVLS